MAVGDRLNAILIVPEIFRHKADNAEVAVWRAAGRSAGAFNKPYRLPDAISV
jgi:hypothetical protein